MQLCYFVFSLGTMQTALVLTIILNLLLGAFAQKPHHCKSPPYLQGKLAVDFPEGKTMVYEKFSYDAVEQRIRVVAAGKEGEHDVFMDRLLLFREKVYYDIIYHNKTCVKNYLDAAFVPIAIPSDAKHRAQVVLGSLSAPAEGLLVNNWVGSDTEIKANYSLTFTEFGCIPVVTVYHIDGMGHVLSSFFDMVVGIDDPAVFIPPAFCFSKNLVERKGGKATNHFTALL
ncbi:ependymin [Tachysurus fulvidraco]|uniref:ependymin n=1 Tax=Tachysurus fulvidraco TaxID=1234273 RepID=UPI001FEF7CB5|nr:ependymin [Tachysurus fulvidraco]